MNLRLATIRATIQHALCSLPFTLLLSGCLTSFSMLDTWTTSVMAQVPNDPNNLPATYHGTVLPDPAVPGFTPAAGMTVNAKITVNDTTNDKPCGQSTTFSENGQVVYRISVLSDSEIDGLPGCGVQGAIVTFFVANQFMQPTVSWSSGAIQEVPLRPALLPTPTLPPPMPPTLMPSVTPTITPPHKPVSIPEPVTIMLFGLGLTTLFAYRAFSKYKWG